MCFKFNYYLSTAYNHLLVHIIDTNVKFLLLYFFFEFYLNKNACPYLYVLKQFDLLCFLFVLVFSGDHTDFFSVYHLTQVIVNGKNIDSSFACLLFYVDLVRIPLVHTQLQHKINIRFSLFSLFPL